MAFINMQCCLIMPPTVFGKMKWSILLADFSPKNV